MQQGEAIHKALEEVRRRGTAITDDPPKALYKERHMHLGKNRSGWLVVFRLNVPESFEPNHLHVEVYEPDGEVHVPELL